MLQVVPNVENANYWLALEDNEHVTAKKVYELFQFKTVDEKEQIRDEEYFIQDDSGKFAMWYICCNGLFLGYI